MSTRSYSLIPVGLLVIIPLLILTACVVDVEPASDPCFSAKIISPGGDRSANGDQAEQYSIERTGVPIKWDPPECTMIIQYYQNYKPRPELDTGEVKSGHTIHMKGSGKTEIKIWRKGFSTQSDAIWVWVR
jgi:hypothetical protein